MKELQFVILGMALLSGCDDGRIRTYPVTGRVQFSDGVPVRTGSIEFKSVDFGTTAVGTIQEDGRFVLGTYSSSDGATAGKHQVVIVQIVIADGTFRHTKDHGRPVLPRYGRYATSGLTAMVEALQSNEVLLTLPEEPR